LLSEQKMKNLIDKKAKETNLPKQQLYGLYGLEQFLLKLNGSPYKDNLILKGGYLLSSVYGLNNRVTRDLDTTMINSPLTKEFLEELTDFITSPNEGGEEHFELRGIKETRENFDYNGYELKLLFKNGRSRIPLSIDFTTGEDLAAIEKGSKIPLIFEDNKSLVFPSYSIEQIIIDKFYTTIAYGKYDDTNSRMKDYYDIHLLSTIGEDIDYSLVNEGLSKVMNQRDEVISKDDFESIILSLRESENQKSLWEKYRSVTPFAKEIEFDDVIDKMLEVSDNIISVGHNHENNTFYNRSDDFEW